MFPFVEAVNIADIKVRREFEYSLILYGVGWRCALKVIEIVH